MSARRWTRQPAAWCLLLRLASILVNAHPSPDLSNLHGHVSLGSGAKPLEPLSQMKHAARLEEHHRSPSASPEDDASPAAPLAAFARRYLADSGLGTSKLTAVPGLSPCKAKAHASSSFMIMYGLPIKSSSPSKGQKATAFVPQPLCQHRQAFASQPACDFHSSLKSSSQQLLTDTAWCMQLRQRTS